MMKAVIIASLLSMTAGAASAQTVNTADPAEFSKALATLGYKPTPINPNEGFPLFTATVNDWNTVFLFGGCDAGKKCKYLVLISSFSDVKNPPKEWVNKTNQDLDVGKVWVDETGRTSFSFAIPTAGEPMPTTLLRYTLDQWGGLVHYISNSAVEQKLNK